MKNLKVSNRVESLLSVTGLTGGNRPDRLSAHLERFEQDNTVFCNDGR